MDQNRIVSTVRSSEVVSDPSNVLALEAALRRRSGVDQAHLASSHRVLRAQRFVGSDDFAHFVIFALVSSARDSGSARTEAQMLFMHLDFWQQVLSDLLGRRGVERSLFDFRSRGTAGRFGARDLAAD